MANRIEIRVHGQAVASREVVQAAPVARHPPASACPRRSALTAPAVAGIGLLAGYTLLAIGAPWIAPYDPAAFVGPPFEAPSPRHWLGTNDVGQDILSEMIYGTRVSLLVALSAAAASLGVASVWGALAGYVRGWPEVLLMRTVDVVLAMPHLPLMALLAVYLTPGMGTIVLTISALAWPIPARIVRAETLSLRSRDYVAASRLLGAGTGHVIRRHLLPALAPVLLATFVGLAGRAVMVEAGLAFLGLGDPTTKSWGAIMRAATSYSGIFFTPHWVWWLGPAGLNVGLLVLAFTLIGMGLESWLDPRLQRQGP